MKKGNRTANITPNALFLLRAMRPMKPRARSWNNAARNAYISYARIQTNEMNQIANWPANSSEMPRRFYQNPGTPQQAKAWFNLRTHKPRQ